MSRKIKRLPKSIRKYIRLHKSLIRRQFSDKNKRQCALDELIQKFGHLVKDRGR